MRCDRTLLQERDHAVFWHPCSQMKDYEAFPPLQVASARGGIIELVDGSRVYDAISSWWCKSLGHGHPRLRAAAAAQLERFEHIIAANTTHEAIVSLCERLLALCNGPASGHFTKVFFADNGSTGVEVALKMALQAQQQQRGQTKRTKLASFSNGYHGETAGAMSVSDLDLYTSPHGPMMFEVLKLGPLPYRSGPSDARWMDASAEWPAIERQLNASADALAAVVYEPVLQAAGRMKLYSPDLLRRLRDWADAHGVYLIADEIASGLHRCGGVLASHLSGVLPDVVVLSKGLTAGFSPMSAVLATQAMYELFYDDYATGRAFLHSNTYAGHALGVAVAHAALDVYRDEDIPGNVCVLYGLLHERLVEMARRGASVCRPRVLGAVGAIDLCGPDEAELPTQARTGYRVYRSAVRRGVLCRPLGDTMYVFPPLNTTSDDLCMMLELLAGSIDEVTGA